jgi:hypothetical protein
VADSDPGEGWYTDPYGLHEARWLSGGKPTKLVRDHGVESYDEPPAEPPRRDPARIEPPCADPSSDLRADDAERGGKEDGDGESLYYKLRGLAMPPR